MFGIKTNNMGVLTLSTVVITTGVAAISRKMLTPQPKTRLCKERYVMDDEKNLISSLAIKQSKPPRITI